LFKAISKTSKNKQLIREKNILTLIAKRNTLNFKKSTIITKKFVTLLFIIKVKSKSTKRIIIVRKKFATIVKLKSRTKVKSNKIKDRKLISELSIINKTYSIYFYCYFLLLIIRIIVLKL